MASQNGGHISKSEQNVLNQQENAVSKWPVGSVARLQQNLRLRRFGAVKEIGPPGGKAWLAAAGGTRREEARRTHRHKISPAKFVPTKIVHFTPRHVSPARSSCPIALVVGVKWVAGN